MPTIEERVEALEAQMALIENTKYEMNYSGPEIETLLDFVKDRKIIAGHKSATISTDKKTFTAAIDYNYDDYINRPVALVKLGYVTEGSTVNLREFPSLITNISVTRSGGKIYFIANTSQAPTSDTSAVYIFTYIIMEATS